MRTTHIIGIGNQKGGVSKTTNAIHLAAALGERGHKCLVIDLDPNLGLTESFDIPATTLGTFHLLMGEESPEDVIISEETRQERASRPGEVVTLPKNVDVIPANRRIENFDEEWASSAEGGKQFMAGFDTLRGPMEALKGVYDYIFLDTAPRAGTLTVAAYKTASWFILSSTAEKLSVDALRRAMGDIAAAGQVNPDLRLLGVLMSQVDTRRKLERTYIAKVQRDLEAAGGFGLFETVIPSRAVLGKASTLCQSLFDYEPEGNEMKTTNEVRDLYRQLAEEIEGRVGRSASIEAKPEAQTEVKAAAHG
ncbi:MAG: ParA family protein [Phycisphaerales bacterium]|nr:ParA family protein [Phycisphaerales bacterium]